MLAGVVWLTSTLGGLAFVAAYDNRPGPAAHAPARWPDTSELQLDADRPTLVMIAHPKCDCTKASLGELAELMARAPGQLRAYVLFVNPPGAPAGWQSTDLWQAVKQIPGVLAVNDDGKEGHRFGAETSGQTFLYAPSGSLLFEGGITRARGHLGESVGRAAILASLNGDTTSGDAPVFGCPLFSAPEAGVTQ